MTTIREELVPKLIHRFGLRAMRLGAPPDPIAMFRARHFRVGDVSIWDDGHEATVAIGEISHGRFGLHDPELTADQAASSIADDVVDFLDRLFADRVLLWRSRDGGAGGWRDLDEGESISPTPGGDAAYVWSGPLVSRERK